MTPKKIIINEYTESIEAYYKQFKKTPIEYNRTFLIDHNRWNNLIVSIYGSKQRIFSISIYDNFFNIKIGK